MGIKKIAILGAGHGGFAAAADLTARGFEVRLHARRQQTLSALKKQGGVFVRTSVPPPPRESVWSSLSPTSYAIAQQDRWVVGGYSSDTKWGGVYSPDSNEGGLLS